MRDQSGFAALEIILILMIFSMLTAVALPKINKFVDVAALNFEVQKFRSEFLFAKSVSRSSSYDGSIFSSAPISNGRGIYFFVEEDGYKFSYNYIPVREKNFLQKNFKIACPRNLQSITFVQGKPAKFVSGTYKIISPLKNERFLKLDSVGRLRIDVKN